MSTGLVTNATASPQGAIGSAVAAGALGAAVGGGGFYAMHKYALGVEGAALRRATPGPAIALGATSAAVTLFDRAGLRFGDGTAARIGQGAGVGALVMTALTHAHPMFHGTAQPIAISTLVNAALGAVVGAGVAGILTRTGD